MGDVLLILAAGEGTETDELKTQLETAKYSYQQKLINMSGGGSEVTRAQEKLQEAIAARDAIAVNITAEDIELAKVRYETAKEYYQQLTYELEDAGGYVEGGKGDTLKELGDAVNAAQLEYDSNCIRYKNEKYYIEDILASEAARQLYKDKQACAEAIADVFAASERQPDRLLRDLCRQHRLPSAKRLGLNIYIFDRNASYVTNLPSQALADIAKGYNAIREARDALDQGAGRLQQGR